ncbi:MAG: ABC transporter ATP-binding protein [Dongiaceae bacterium]
MQATPLPATPLPATPLPATPLLEARDLKVWFPARRAAFAPRRWIRAVDGVSLAVMPGETLAVVGESGCGKTTLGRALVMLERPTGGEVVLEGTDLTGLGRRALRERRRRMQMVFQDPFGSLDPRQSVAAIVAEPLRIAGAPAAARRARVAELLELVGLPPDAARRLPREFSGGQRQRIGIARALAGAPLLVVCDEPLSALDVSIQAQIVNLLLQLQARLGLAYLFISHDLAVVRQIATRVAVMYLGTVVELAATADLFAAPRHPYSVALLAAVPQLATDPQVPPPAALLSGDPPSPAALPPGCRFHGRCWLYERLGRPEICRRDPPALATGDVHPAACHFAAQTAAHAPAVAPMLAR